MEVCRLHGQSASRASLSAGLPLVDGRMTLALTERAATRVGMSARVQRLALDALNEAALPAILVLKNNRACVLLGWDASAEGGRIARVLLPETGQGSVTLPHDTLENDYTGVTLFARPHFRFDQRTADTSAATTEHWFWGALLRQRLVYRDVLWAAFLINVFALVFPLFSMNVYDRVVPNHALETLWALAIGVLLVISCDLAMRMLRGRFVDEASARIDLDISSSLMERVLGMQLSHRPQSVGSFASNLRGFEQVRDFIASSTVTALIDLPFALLFIGVMLWISPWLALPVLAAFVLIIVCGYVLQHRLNALSVSTYKAAAQRNALLIETLGGIETIKCQGAEGVIQARWEQANRFLSRLGVQMRGLSTSAQYATSWVQQMVSVVTIVTGVYLIADKQLTMGALIASTMLASRALAPSAQIVGLLMQYQGARTAMTSLNQVMERPVERPAGSNFIHRREFKGEIEFRNVKFAYPNRSDSALDGVSFRIQAGDRVALIGKVGSGKTTMQKAHDGPVPTHRRRGAARWDRPAPARPRRRAAQHRLCVSGREPLLRVAPREHHLSDCPMPTTPRWCSRPRWPASPTSSTATLRATTCRWGSAAKGLSGGQRQSVGLARAVLHNAPLFLLDEPTSAMDFSTEAHVTARLSEFARQKTVVLVTHRTSMLAMVNRVIVVDNGKIVADGPRDRIMEALQAGRIARAA